MISITHYDLIPYFPYQDVNLKKLKLSELYKVKNFPWKKSYPLCHVFPDTNVNFLGVCKFLVVHIMIWATIIVMGD